MATRGASSCCAQPVVSNSDIQNIFEESNIDSSSSSDIFKKPLGEVTFISNANCLIKPTEPDGGEDIATIPLIDLSYALFSNV